MLTKLGQIRYWGWTGGKYWAEKNRDDLQLQEEIRLHNLLLSYHKGATVWIILGIARMGTYGGRNELFFFFFFFFFFVVFSFLYFIFFFFLIFLCSL